VNIQTGIGWFLGLVLTSGIAFAQSSSYLYSANGQSNDVSAYLINPATGGLTPVPGSPFVSGSIAHGVTAHPCG
jgi:6-phosphogluconolactonase